MPDLGTYAVEVGLAYAVTLGLLGAIIALTIVQSRKARKALEDAEARWKNG